MTSINVRFNQALASKSSTDALIALAKGLFIEGYSDEEVYSLFDKKRDEHKNDSDESKYSAISETMDLLAGRNLPTSSNKIQPPPFLTVGRNHSFSMTIAVQLLIPLVLLCFVAYAALFMDCFTIKIGAHLLCREESPIAFWGALSSLAFFAGLLLREVFRGLSR